MRNTTVLITGCQRSGTTLVRLVLDTHPDIRIVDEDRFDYANINTYLYASSQPAIVGFKLPRYAQIPDFSRMLPDLRILWCVRHPLDVVWSMMNLQVAFGRHTEIPWATHPACAQAEVINCYWALSGEQRSALERHMEKFGRITTSPPESITRRGMIFCGALCWRMKQELLTLYARERTPPHCIKYEDLVSDTRTSLDRILKYIGASWHDNLLEHHRIHKGVSVGETSNTRPIDESSVGQGIRNLEADEVGLVSDLCGSLAGDLGYGL